MTLEERLLFAAEGMDFEARRALSKSLRLKYLLLDVDVSYIACERETAQRMMQGKVELNGLILVRQGGGGGGRGERARSGKYWNRSVGFLFATPRTAATQFHYYLDE